MEGRGGFPEITGAFSLVKSVSPAGFRPQKFMTLEALHSKIKGFLEEKGYLYGKNDDLPGLQTPNFETTPLFGL